MACTVNLTRRQELSPAEEKTFKQKYVDALTSKDDCFPVIHGSVLDRLTVEKVQALYLNLEDMFSPACNNEDRKRIVSVFLKVDEDQWPALVKQIRFIIPYTWRGHDIAWAAEIIASIPDLACREKFVNKANCLFTYDTLPIERCYILRVLGRLPMDEVVELATADEEVKAEFIKSNVPASLKEGARIAAVIDPIQKLTWKA